MAALGLTRGEMEEFTKHADRLRQMKPYQLEEERTQLRRSRDAALLDIARLKQATKGSL